MTSSNEIPTVTSYDDATVTRFFPTSGKPNVADAYFDKNIRIIVLAVEIIAGSIGGSFVCAWLWFNRRRHSRVNVIILNVTLTDLLVVGYACGMQLVWELMERVWVAGDVGCRLMKWAQSFSMISSNYMLVILSFDRHQAIIWPLKKSFSATRLCAFGWILGAVLSLPQLYVFHQNVPTEGRWKNMTLCESIFRDVPVTHRQAYLTYVALVVFYIPLVVILFCYLRIYLKIARKSEEGKSTGSGRKSTSSKPGKIHLQSTTSNSLSKAKSKTLKMTVVIVFSFVVCNLPIHILEAIMSFGDHTLVSGQVMAILGATAVANSATNPFVFLLFNASQMQCLQLRAAHKRDSQKATMRRSGTTKSDNQELRSCKTTCMSTDGGGPIEEDETTQVVPFVQDHPPRSNDGKGRHDLARIQGCATVLLVESDTEMMVVSGVD